MKALRLSAVLPLVALMLVGCGREEEPPNLVIILADDMGYSDVGAYGSEIETPALDRLAEGGLRFRQFYNAARCCPTRASLLTGLYPHQAGMGRMVSAVGQPIEAGPYQGFLADSSVTLAEALGQAGYRTYMSGKWHVGERPEHWPTKRGFDRYWGLISGASSYFEVIRDQPRHRQIALDGEPWTPPDSGFYMTTATTDWAVDFLQQHAEEAPDRPLLPLRRLHRPALAPPRAPRRRRQVRGPLRRSGGTRSASSATSACGRWASSTSATCSRPAPRPCRPGRTLPTTTTGPGGWRSTPP